LALIESSGLRFACEVISEARTRLSTILLMSRCSLREKSLYIVDPPERTMFFVKLLNLVETATGIYRTTLDDLVNNIGERGEEIGAYNLWTEEYFGAHEALKPNIDRVWLS
jgi:hypothetical protein